MIFTKCTPRKRSSRRRCNFRYAAVRRLWYNEPNAIGNAINYAKFYSRSNDAVIRVCDSVS
jgi:hypothetical protein